MKTTAKLKSLIKCHTTNDMHMKGKLLDLHLVVKVRLDARQHRSFTFVAFLQVL